jgi:hypothetical protein
MTVQGWDCLLPLLLPHGLRDPAADESLQLQFKSEQQDQQIQQQH